MEAINGIEVGETIKRRYRVNWHLIIISPTPGGDVSRFFFHDSGISFGRMVA